MYVLSKQVPGLRRLFFSRLIFNLAAVLGLAQTALVHWLSVLLGASPVPTAGLIGLAAVTLATTGRMFLNRARRAKLARQISNQLRTLDRSAESVRGSLDRIPWRTLDGGRFESFSNLAVGPDRRLHVLADGGLHSLDLAVLDGD